MTDPLRPEPPDRRARRAIAGVCEDAMRDAARAVARFVDEARAPLVIERTGVEARTDVLAAYSAAAGPSDDPQRAGDPKLVLVAFDLGGAVTGSFAQVLDEGSATQLASMLFGRPTNVDEAIGAIAEAGNIAASAFLNRLAGHLGGACLPSVPRLFVGAASTTLGPVLAADDVVSILFTLGGVRVRLTTTAAPVAPVRRGWPA